MKVKVLIISSQYPPTIGGGGTHTSYLTHELCNINSHRVEVCLLTSSIPGLPKLEKKHNGVLLHRVDFRHSEGLIYEAAIAKGLQLCESFKPDIIHGQHIDGALVGLHLKSAFDIPLIVTLHKTPLLRYDETIPKRHSIYSTIRMLTRLNYIDSFVMGSKIFEKEMLQIAGPFIKTKFIYHGVPYNFLESLAYDPNRIAIVTQEIGFSASDFLIICPSRLDERKGLEVLVKAVAKVKKEQENLAIKVVITGEAKDGNHNEQQLMDTLERLAEEGGFKDNLIFKKFPYDLLPALFGIANVCVLPSRKEGLGLVLLEALSVRCPVIAANSPGIDEVIDSDQNGLLFEPEDANDLHRQIIRLIENPKLAESFKNKGYHKVKKLFSAKRMAAEHLKLYMEQKKARN